MWRSHELKSFLRYKGFKYVRLDWTCQGHLSSNAFLQSGSFHVQWNVLRDHSHYTACALKAWIFLVESLYFNSNEPRSVLGVTEDHLSWETTFYHQWGSLSRPVSLYDFLFIVISDIGHIHWFLTHKSFQYQQPWTWPFKATLLLSDNAAELYDFLLVLNHNILYALLLYEKYDATQGQI